jgi:hypothetical protein
LNPQKWKNYTILSIVLMVFLCYPMLVKLTLSMLKCPIIGQDPETKQHLAYLMADLQEPCFKGRHLENVLSLTIPQLLLYVIGLPLLATLIILRNKHRLHEKEFYTRYGLLYMGYREGREWWELIIAIRKVCIVAIGTFGTLLGVVDLQAFVALGIVFLSIIVHLIGQPFDITRANARRLHNLEFVALTVCWMTFWGGLLFFLGREKKNSVSAEVQILMTVLLVSSNCLFLLGATFVFVKEYLRDRKVAQHRRKTRQLSNKIQIVPVSNSNETNENEKENEKEKNEDEG